MSKYCSNWRWQDGGYAIEEGGYCALGPQCHCAQRDELDNYAYWRPSDRSLLTHMAVAYGVALTVALIFFYWMGYLR